MVNNSAPIGKIGRTPSVAGSPAYYIRLVVDDGQGNTNEVYSRWPVIVGAGPGAVADDARKPPRDPEVTLIQARGRPASRSS